MSALSAATMPTGVVRKTPRAPRPMRLIAAAWCSPSTPFLRFHVSSAAYNKIPWAAAAWRFRAEAGGTPYRVISRRILASASSRPMVCALVLGGVGLSMGVHKLWLGQALIVRMKLGCLQDILWSENTQMQFCFAVMNPSGMTAPQSRKHWESTLFDHPQSCVREQRS